VNRGTLLAKRLIRSKDLPVKILGGGKLSRKLVVEVEKLTAGAREAILKAGGKVGSDG